MSKLHWLTALAVVGTVMISMNLPAQPKNEFKITSFIPEKFKDFEWTVQGNAELSGSKSASLNSFSSNPDSDHSENHSSQLDADLNGATRPRYEMYTRKYSLVIDLPLELWYFNSASDYYDTLTGLTRKDIEKHHSNGTRYQAELSPAIDWQDYSFGDWFTSFEATGRLFYQYIPDSENSEEDRNSYWNESGSIGIQELNRKAETSMSRRNNRVNGVVRVGFGRMYSGYYATTAIYFCNELRRHGVLLSEPDYVQLLALTELIYQRRLLHAVDSREYQIATYGALLEYVQSEGLVDSSNMAILLLQDVWQFFPVDSRKFGMQVSFGRGFEIEYASAQTSSTETYRYMHTQHYNDSVAVDTLAYENYVSTQTNHNKNHSEQQYLTILSEISRPLSLKWQFDGSAEARAYLNSTSDPSSTGSRQKVRDRYLLDIRALLRCIVNSRSSFAFLGTSTYSTRKESWIASDGTETSLIQPSTWSWAMYGSFSLRIAMPTTLSFGASVLSNVRETDGVSDYRKNSDTDFRIWIGLNHHIY